MNKNKVTVYIPTHRRPKLLKRAIESVLKQSYKDIELIVVSDGLDPETDKLMDNYLIRYPNLIYLKYDKPKGACVARNLAINKASGFFITGLDDDDYFTEDRIEFLVSKWEDKYSFICTKSIFEKRLDSVFYALFSKLNKDLIFGHKDLIKFNCVGNQVFTKASRLKSELFDERLPALQDWELWIRLIKAKGLAKRFRHRTQVKDFDHGFSRISNFERRVRGLSIVKDKHSINNNEIELIKTLWKMEYNMQISMHEYLKLLKGGPFWPVLKMSLREVKKLAQSLNLSNHN
ncbi:glycosyltransferase [Thalassotalea sp. PS06]|uniref:glycosyltransferase n=1 Tax=Thalassotalea sp. PS06 TaxID=2594005 RepID=UPI0011639057|nr:glycosyltransferase [Thalassotalea sp. PS06]QDP01987.1 glycosyltransferase [Thalassotalea sp. PS06]